MNDETFVQLFWLIFLVTSFCILLLIGGLIGQRLERWDYFKFVRHQKARSRWAEMMTKSFNKREEYK